MTEKKDIKKEIGKWLESQGYPLEMKVASELRHAGFDVHLSNFYSDPENDTIREIDIVASYPDFTGCLDIFFVIECKVSKKKPWLLFSTEHTLQGFGLSFPFCIISDSARRALVKEKYKSFIELPWMKRESRVAHGITQAFTSGEDMTFKATTSVLKAAIARKRDLNKQSWKPFVFVFPTIIVDGTLFECYLNDSGRVVTESLQDIDMFFPWIIGEDIGTCIRIFTFDRLSAFISQATSVVETLTSLLEHDIKEKIKSIRSGSDQAK